MDTGALYHIAISRSLQTKIKKRVATSMKLLMINFSVGCNSTIAMSSLWGCPEKLHLAWKPISDGWACISKPMWLWLLHEWQWLPVCFQVQLKMLVIIYKALHSIGALFKGHLFSVISVWMIHTNRVGMLRCPQQSSVIFLDSGSACSLHSISLISPWFPPIALQRASKMWLFSQPGGSMNGTFW